MNLKLTRNYLSDIEALGDHVGMKGRYEVRVGDIVVCRTNDENECEAAVRALNMKHPRGPRAYFHRHTTTGRTRK